MTTLFDCCGDSEVVCRSCSSRGSIHLRETSIREGVIAYSFTGVVTMRNVINLQYKKLQEGISGQQYLSFEPVTEYDLEQIDTEHPTSKGMAITYYRDMGLLIVKIMPSVYHERAHVEIWGELRDQFRDMGVYGEVVGCGATRYSSLDGTSSKEGDGGFQLRALGAASWPTIVIEVGLSESLPHLRVSACWWLENGNGQVQIVLICSLAHNSPGLLHFEKWTRDSIRRRGSSIRARVEQTVVVDSLLRRVTGSPLTLEFDKIFLRQPVPPRERNIDLHDQDLVRLAELVWI